jgi:hypothetical protein
MRIIKLHVIKTPTGWGTPVSFIGGEMRVNGDDIRAYNAFEDQAFLNEADELAGENGTPYKGSEIMWRDGTTARFAESPEEIDEALFGGFGRKRRPHLADDMTLEVAAVIAGGIMADPNVSTRGGIEGAREAASILIAENAKRRRANRGIRG